MSHSFCRASNVDLTLTAVYQPCGCRIGQTKVRMSTGVRTRPAAPCAPPSLAFPGRHTPHSDQDLPVLQQATATHGVNGGRSGGRARLVIAWGASF